MPDTLVEALASLGADVTYAAISVKHGQAKLVKGLLPWRALPQGAEGIAALEDLVLATGWGEIGVTMKDGRPVGCTVEKHVKVEE